MTQPADDQSDKPNFELVPDPDAAKVEGGNAEAGKAEASAAEPAGPDASKTEATASKSDGEAGRALAPAGAAPIHPFIAAATAGEKIEVADAPRTVLSRMLDYSAHAAIVVGLIGFAWTVSDHVISHPAKTDAAAPVQAAALPPKPAKLDEMAELKLANQKMHDEIRTLKASVDQLRVAARRDTTPEQVRMLSAGLDNVKSGLAASRSETNAAIAQLTGKVDKLQPGKLQALSERVGHLERQTIDPASTGSIAKADKAEKADKSEKAETAKAAPKPPVKPTELASLDEPQQHADDDKPQVISGWVVRDVYDGVALIEGKRGTMEVMRGVTIPGAGVVKSIDRHGNGWTVTTTKGQLAFAAPQQQSWRRGPNGPGGYGPYGRGGYPPYRYDY